MRFYNTRTHSIDQFKPLRDNQVGVYTCGPTVYHYAHIGNLRTYVFEDVLVRALRHSGYNVTHVMNITDVGHLTDDGDNGEDKMEKGSRREGKTAWEVAQFYTDAFMKDIRELNIHEPTIWCKATDHIPEQIAQIQTLIDKGFTYDTSDGIYFDTTKFPAYGEMAGLQKQELKAGARVEMGEKKNPHDFALWKFSKPEEKRQMEWEAFGRMGFPGWHIECSAMSMKYLGNEFAIHCGGVDHIPVHHTNEIAQAEASTGVSPWVQVWMHGEFLLVDEGKMAKSGDNFLTLSALIEKGYDPLAYRYFLLQAHYRKQLTFSFEALDAAANGLKNLRAQIQKIEPNTQTNHTVEREFWNAVENDLNTPEALGVLWTALKDKQVTTGRVIEFDKVLGLNLHEIKEEQKIEILPEVQLLLDQRTAAREQQDWALSDALREQIAKKYGLQVKDTSEGQIVSKI